MSDDQTQDSHLLATRAGAVLTLTLNRPDALNALTPEMLNRLADELDSAALDESLRVVVLTGAGRAFSAGVDLKALGGRRLTGGMVGDILDIPARRALDCMSRMPQVVIGKLNGHCFTGALELALGCDLLFAADDAKLGDTHVKWGVRPTWGMSQRLPRRIGYARARYLALTARSFTATKAHDWGLVNGVCAASELDALVETQIEAVLSNSPDVLAAYKDLWRRSEGLPLEAGLALEAQSQYEIRDTNDRLKDFLS
ncbi:MAG: enoyl-CoA hydratase/isomerase family protein [Pseudomonadota bacterium]